MLRTPVYCHRSGLLLDHCTAVVSLTTAIPSSVTDFLGVFNRLARFIGVFCDFEGAFGIFREAFLEFFSDF